jgi:hypothetical protein
VGRHSHGGDTGWDGGHSHSFSDSSTIPEHPYVASNVLIKT